MAFTGQGVLKGAVLYLAVQAMVAVALVQDPCKSPCKCIDTKVDGIPGFQLECDNLRTIPRFDTKRDILSLGVRLDITGAKLENTTALGALTSLKWLLLFNTSLEKVPPEMRELVNLAHLSLPINQISNVEPGLLQNLQRLNSLSFVLNRLTQVPFDIRYLTGLQRLYLKNNLITAVDPRAFEKLVVLQNLDMSHNLLREVPSGINYLSGLKKLYLNNNFIRVLNFSFFRSLKNLDKLFLSGNKLISIPPDMSLLAQLDLSDPTRQDSESLDNCPLFQISVNSKNTLYLNFGPGDSLDCRCNASFLKHLACEEGGTCGNANANIKKTERGNSTPTVVIAVVFFALLITVTVVVALLWVYKRRQVQSRKSSTVRSDIPQPVPSTKEADDIPHSVPSISEADYNMDTYDTIYDDGDHGEDIYCTIDDFI